MSFSFRLARAEDDEELRAVSYEASMTDDGLYCLGYGREPSFFHALDVEGSFHQTGFFVDEAGRGAATFTRSIRKLFVNGEVRDVGYLANARVRPEFRGSTLVFRGYKELEKLHRDGRSPFYLSTFLDGNKRVIDLLTSARASLPTYHQVSRLNCYSMLLGKRYDTNSKLELRRGSDEMLPDIVDCLNRNNQRRQFAPYWRVEDFAGESKLTRGLSCEDFVVACRAGKVVGVLAKWDQGGFKQMTLLRYNLSMKAVKLLWNFVMPRLGYSSLPEVGEGFELFFAALPAVDEDDLEVFSDLLKTLLNQNAKGDYLCCVLGLCEGSPFGEIASSFLNFTYASRLYVVTWKDGEAAFDRLDGRQAYVELATL